MTELHIDILEAVWITVNVSAFVLTVGAFIDARRLQQSARLEAERAGAVDVGAGQVGGGARLIQANGNVRREIVRLVTQLTLLSIVIPGLTSDQTTPLDPIVLALMAIPVLVFLNTVSDAWDRRKLAGIVWAQIASERGSAFSRLERAIAENTRISQLASDNSLLASEHALEAYKEANHVNLKIATQGAAIVAQGEDRAADRRERAADRADDRRTATATASTLDDTSEKVTEIHHTIIPAPGT